MYNSSYFFELLLQNLKYMLLMFVPHTGTKFYFEPQKNVNNMDIFNALDHRHLTVYINFSHDVKQVTPKSNHTQGSIIG